MALPFITPARLLTVAALALALQGCGSTSMSKNECLTADWYAIGYESGIRGQREAQISQHRKACAEHGITPDLARFLQGRDVGLQRYCEPRNGYRLGRNGTNYDGICPQRLDGEFTSAYRAGRELYDTEQNINRYGRRIGNLQSDLNALNDDLNRKQSEIIAPGTLPARRALLLTEIIELRDKIKNIEHDIHDARLARDRERDLLQQLERRDVGR
ncbi:MAG: DUF2799 domain-containing protein [Betaproteobacteria bacterium]|jgi:hypothetical protein|nr:DUF2799 domain-containing protein [Betaproteobacteria bacterium]MDH4293938.1 DUF2799 domain-containing protein [Betaproteobacteria bacterium]MDH5342216.1 DUF2799 domain-containing protein [Betaproteobacteria bacterium]